MKLIATSNFNEDTVSDILLATGLNANWGNQIMELMNKHICTDYSDYFFQLVEDDHKLYEFDY